MVKNQDDTIEHIIAADAFIQKHPRHDSAILISKSASNQREQDSIVLYVDRITEVAGASFSGNREDLFQSIATLFRRVGGDGGGSQFSGDYNDLTNIPDLTIYQPKHSIGESVFCVFAEESGGLRANAFQWS